jgi:hypothetical protein
MEELARKIETDFGGDCRHKQVVLKLVDLYETLFHHEGYGEMKVNMRFLRKGQKEVIISCGKEYRYVLDYPCPCERGS